MKINLIFLLLLFTGYQLFAQKKRINSVNAIYLNFTGAYQLPQGDMKERFDANTNISLHAEWITGKSNYIFGLNGSFLYQDRVKEDVAALFREQGVVLGTDQAISNLQLKERGLTYGLHFGKLFPINPKKNPRSGIRVTLGIGYLRHWIKLSDEYNSVNQFQRDYIKGYDRLTAGIAVTPFLGYQYTSLNRYVNVLLGVEYVGAWTRSQRSWDYDRFGRDTAKRRDGLLGFRIGFSLPLYIGDSKGDVEYP